MWSVERVTAQLFQPTGHGIVLRVTGSHMDDDETAETALRSSRLTLTSDAFRALPPGVETLARFTYLPMHLGEFVKSCRCARGRFDMEIHVGTKENGQFGVTHRTLMEHVRKMARKGDKPFAAELLGAYRDDVLMALPTRPSLIISSIESSPRDGSTNNGRANPTSMLLRNPPDFHARTWIGKALSASRWLVLPVLFAAVTCAVVAVPHRTIPLFPEMSAVVHIVPRAANATSFVAEIPPVPDKLSQAWELGQLELKLGSGSNADEAQLLDRAATILGCKKVTAEQLHGIPQRIAEIEAHRGVIARVRGFFSFVNMVWLLSILGITVSIGPALAVLVAPLVRLIVRVAKWVWSNVVLPVIKFLHNSGVFEVAAYVLCLQLTVDGARLPREWGVFVTITGLALSFLAFGYSTLLHAAPLRELVTNEKFIVPVIGVWAAVIWGAWAIFFRSRFLAFLSVAAVYSALGFSVVCFGLCWLIGFNDKDAMLRVTVASSVLLVVFSLLRIVGLEPEVVQVFGPAVQVLGSITLLLSMLINCSYWNDNNLAHFWEWQAAMVALLGTMLFIGNVWVLEGITNTAATFLVIYLMEKWVEVHTAKRWNMWVLVLIVSVAMWRIALFLHSHPHFVISIFV